MQNVIIILGGLFAWWYLNELAAFLSRHYVLFISVLYASLAVTVLGLLRDLDRYFPIPRKFPFLSVGTSNAIYRFLDDMFERPGNSAASWSSGSSGMASTGAAKEKRIKRIADGQFGNARFMGERDLQLLSSTGNIILGQLHDHPRSPLIKYRLHKHAITIAATRSGKGVSSIGSNLLYWRNPVVVIDPKPEAIFITHEFRSTMFKQIVLDPMGLVKSFTDQAASRGKFIAPIETHSFNFLDFVRDDEDGPQDINALLTGLIIPTVNGDSHWDDKAKVLIAAFIGWVKALYPPEERHLGTVYDLMTLGQGTDQDDQKLKTLLNEMSKNTSVFYGVPSKGAAAILSAEDKERSGIFSSALKALDWLSLPKLRRNVTTSSFDITDLCRGKIDLTIVLPPDLMEKGLSSRRWLRAVSAIPGSLVQRITPTKPILFILDEAADIGRLDSVVSAFRQGAGRRLHVWLFTQTLAGLRETWGAEVVKDMLGNADFVEYFRPPGNTFDEVKDLSEKLSKFSYQKVSENENSGTGGKLFNIIADSKSKGKGKSVSTEGADLMTFEELINMKLNEKIVIHTSTAVHPPLPINCFQARYFEREEFVGLVGPNPHFHDDEDPNYVAQAVGPRPVAANEQSPDSAPASVAANARDDVTFVVDEEDLIPMIRLNVAAWIEERHGTDFKIADLTEGQIFSLVPRGDLLGEGGVALFMSQFETVCGDEIERAHATPWQAFEFIADDLNGAELSPMTAEAA